MDKGKAGKKYVAIDLKSFYASVECVERGLDPLRTNLVVADKSRTDKTICLAVSPALKAYGIPGRPGLFEVVQKVNAVNIERQRIAPNRILEGSSCLQEELKENPSLALDYITAPPQMAKYIERSTQIYGIYLRYIAPEDIHVYSIDEVFMDVTGYLHTYKMDAEELTRNMIKAVLYETGITATAGIGTNLYLSKIAMDIVAKHMPADENGVRIAELDELSYRRQLWAHRPLTDFWRIGRGYADKLEAHGLYTMGDIALCSTGGPEEYYNEELLYRLFGIEAELLIDHAWGWEPCTIADIKAYKPDKRSLGAGQVLQSPYTFEKARLVVQEMADGLALDLVEKNLVTKQIVLTIGYDKVNLKNKALRSSYQGETKTDRYGREIPKHAHGTANLRNFSSSTKDIIDAVTNLYDRIVNRDFLVRRIQIAAENVLAETEAQAEEQFEQLEVFADDAGQQEGCAQAVYEKERRMQEAVIEIKNRFGKNAVLKGMNFLEGATARERNHQIGGHKA